MPRQKLFESLNIAVEGFIYVLKTQRNMRLHFLIAILVLVAGIYFNLPKSDLLLLLGVITLVLVLEMVNTAIELITDLIKDTYHPMARIIKDITAGAVFLAVLNAVVAGYIIFSRCFLTYMETGVSKIIHSPWHVTFIAFLMVALLAIAGKIIFHSGTPFRGGMPSGHAAFAFSIWTVIVFSTRNGLIVTLSFIMAFLIARHRLKDDIHTFWEVLAGGLLGMLVTACVFQLLL